MVVSVVRIFLIRQKRQKRQKRQIHYLEIRLNQRQGMLSSLKASVTAYNFLFRFIPTVPRIRCAKSLG